MAHSPELLILDEPTSGLDTLVRREFLESMVDIAAAGRTVLLSSHQIGEVERVADIVAIMHKGQLLVNEPLEELKGTTRQLNITVSESSAPRPTLDGAVIYERRQGRQWEVLIRGLDDADLERLRFADSVVAVESRTPSLEEIFVAYIGKDSSPSDLSPSAPIITR